MLVWSQLVEEVREQHSFLDTMVSAWVVEYAAMGQPIFCGRGCYRCCNLAVHATLTEAVAVAGVLSDQQAAAVSRHVARLKELVRRVDDMKGYLRVYRRVVGFCPLLVEDGSCGAYAVRPLSCRALLSTKESRWCGADFAEVPSEEKRAFVESLDPAVVAFPLHYAAFTRELGQEMEAITGRRMAERFGFSLYGNLPVLIHLVHAHGLDTACSLGCDAVDRIMEQHGLKHPFLVKIEG